MNIRSLTTSLFVLPGLVISLNAASINLQNGNFLLASRNLAVEVDRSGNAVDGMFLSIASVMDIALDSHGEILAATDSYPSPQMIYRIDTNGVVLSTNLPPVTFQSFAVAANEDFLLGQGTTIFRVDSGFNFVDVFSIPPAPGSAPAINGIAVAPNGLIYVVAWSQNAQSSVIHQLNAQGNVLQTLGPFAFQVRSITVNTNGHVFYGKENNDAAGFPLPSQIVELDPNGTELSNIQEPIQFSGMTLINFNPLPTLSIQFVSGDLILSWPPTGFDFELQTASITNPANWAAVGITPTNVQSRFQVRVPMSPTGMLFRLSKLN